MTVSSLGPEEDMGAPCGTGSRASHEAADASSPKASIPSALEPGDHRYTVQTIASGQPRAYADTIHHARVTFEWVPYKKREPGEEPVFEPSAGWTEEAAARHLKGLCCGFTDYKYDAKADGSMDAYFRTRLDWLREVAPGVWEFHTTSPYTD